MSSFFATRRQPTLRARPGGQVLSPTRAGLAIIAPGSPELLNNGGLVTDASLWSGYQGTIAWQSSGYAILTGSIDFSVAQGFQYVQTLEVGQRYKLVATISSLDGMLVRMSIRAADNPSGTYATSVETNSITPVEVSLSFTAPELPQQNVAVSYDLFTQSVATHRMGMHGASLKKAGPE
jgi:hypothetical protein